MLTDTHAHLDFPDFSNDLPDLVNRARSRGVHRLITIGTTIEGSRRALAVSAAHGDIYATVGVHPSNAMEADTEFATELRELAGQPRVVALGECGLDYHRLPSRQMHESAVATMAMGNETPADIDGALRDGAVKSRQAQVFQEQLDLAVELNLPVVIHERDSWDDVIEILQPYRGKVRAVFHCFGKSLAHAETVLEMGHLVSFTGIVTFKNAQVVQETATKLPAGTFMVETDCPYLAPVPYRGKRCEPAYVRDTAEFIAQLRGVSVEELAAQTEATANAFFRFAR